MGEIFTVIRTLAITAVIVFCMQVNIGGKSAEAHFVGWLRSSVITQQLNQVAHGAVLGAKRGVEKISQFVSKTIGRNEQNSQASRLSFDLKRSDAYEREQAAKQAAEENSAFVEE